MSSNEKIDSILLKVERPARYIGNEYNLPNINKEYKSKFCMCFPDLYEVGMSNLGIRILYHMINEHKDAIAERCFAPKQDLADLLKENEIDLFSLETKTPLKDFDFLGISVQFEMLYSNILYMLDLANIPFYAKDRDESYPLLIGGGPCSVNPEPFAEYFDIISIGDGEECITNLIDLYNVHKDKGYNKDTFLREAQNIEGVYVPKFYKPLEERFEYIENDGKVKQSFVRDLENSFFPTKMIVPNIEVVHDRPVIELFRGCPNGCRFCQACYFYRPIREKSLDRVLQTAKESIENTGFEEISLASLSSSDYSQISNVVNDLSNICETKGVKLSLPSLRLDSFDAKMVKKSRLGSLTFAPEAGTQRLRDVINKNISDEDIEKSITQAFKVGYKSVKLYFMIGLPTETYEDLDGIREIVLKIKRIYSSMGFKRPLRITASASVFIPKPLTPFQWAEHLDEEEVINRQNYLKQILKIKNVSFNWHGSKSSKLEAVFARGDRRLAKVIETAYRNGAKFDSWSEHFDYYIWEDAFKKENIDMDIYLKEIDIETPLPWDFINFYVSKKHLIREYLKSKEVKCTKSCIHCCQGCTENKIEGCGHGSC